MPLHKLPVPLHEQLLEKWQRLLQLIEWTIHFEEIKPDQVMYPDDIADEDKFFIGVRISDKTNNLAVIYHDVDLYEEAILHELLHVKYPEESEESINVLTGLLLLNVGEGLP